MLKEIGALSNGIEGSRIAIPTANPINYYQAISRPEDAERIEIDGYLFFPSGSGPWPTVILVPGSLGISENNMKAAALITDLGFAACLLDPFNARGVSTTVSNQTQYSFATSAWDVIATASVIRKIDEVDSSRIGTQGHSRGGTAVLSAVCMANWIPNVDSDLFVGVFAAYPWCGHQWSNPQVGKTAILSVIGDLDEWCLPQQVQGYMQAMRMAGADASCRIVANAHHSFDRDTPIEVIEDAAIAPGAPTIYIGDDGAMIHPTTNVPDPDLNERDLMVYALKAGYGRVGARIGTLGNQASLFREYMTDFWLKVMNPTR